MVAFEADLHTSFIQTDLGLDDARELLDGHAHGVGADASVHAEDRLIYGL